MLDSIGIDWFSGQPESLRGGGVTLSACLHISVWRWRHEPDTESYPESETGQYCGLVGLQRVGEGPVHDHDGLMPSARNAHFQWCVRGDDVRMQRYGAGRLISCRLMHGQSQCANEGRRKYGCGVKADPGMRGHMGDDAVQTGRHPMPGHSGYGENSRRSTGARPIHPMHDHRMGAAAAASNRMVRRRWNNLPLAVSRLEVAA